MRLSKIRLSGFKSFVDPTTIKFPSNLMGIVGPNGCGKSNVIDAIRWVLGESSAKTLRGDSMADVIFNGSSGRKPVGQASIELSFDNSDGTIAGPYAGYSEISVRRQVARDGTSNYFLNSARCRRKDITNILLGTGLGSHGYSIIEQGMISRLVEAKPEELRSFLEEAAGISKYKERRRDTEHRIRHTRENLERLSDLREEVDKQLAHLQRQAKAAERYKELKAEERLVGAQLLALRLQALRREVLAQEEHYKQKELALQAAVTAQRGIESEIEKLRVEQADRNERFNDVQRDYYRVGAEIARLEQAIQHRKQTVQRRNEDLRETEERLAEISNHIASDQVELAELNKLLGELNPDLEQAHQRRRESSEALERAERAMDQHRAQWEQAMSELADTERAVEVEAARMEQLSARRERLSREHDEQRTERDAIEFDACEDELTALVAQEEKRMAACTAATQALDAVWSKIRDLRAQEKSLSEALDGLREQLQNDRGRLSSLEALQEAAFGEVSEEVDRWLEEHALKTSSRLAEILDVAPGWERAVETVLGGYLQAVNVDDIDRFAEDLAALASGGVVLLGSGGTDAPTSGAVPAGSLASKVNGPDAVLPLLTGVYAAASVPDAVDVRRRLGNGESVITPDGIWFGRNWVRVNRSDDPQVGVLARGEEIDRLRHTVEAAAQRAQETADALTGARNRLEHLEEERVGAQAELSREQHAHADTKTQLESTRHRLDQLRSRASALDGSIESLATEREAIGEALDQCRGRSAQARARLDALQEQRPALEESRSHHLQLLSEAREKAEQDRQAVQELAIKVESRRSSQESASAALARVKAQQQHLVRRQNELETQIAEASAPLHEEEQTLQAQLDQRLAIEKDLTEARSALEGIDTRLREAQSTRNERQQQVGVAREDSESIRLAVREAQVRAETVAEQFNETGFELQTLLAELPEEADTEQWAETLNRIDRRIQRLGAINLAAIEEFQEQSERKVYLDSQHADLTDALETLENAIRKIDRETRARFKETFDKANQGLGRLFPRLFGGGHAYLEMDGDDLLSSGVTVMARPPGKKISTIHLLSGGEKALTAVALVFSIFELNPAPFCVLDEVDAPLDDANVGRFSDIVKEMAEQVQFVIITHNKTTMESMHQLTGVTMQEPGVSRLVAVDIDEAVELAAM
jgi:chromosome segregation protein